MNKSITYNTVFSKPVLLIKNNYTLKKITTPNTTINTNPNTAINTVKNEYTEKYSELMYSEIMKSINTILTDNNIIKMPIPYHKNIYYVENDTESLIYRMILKKINTDDGTLYIKYIQDRDPTYTALLNITKNDISLNSYPLKTLDFNEVELANNNMLTNFVNAHIFNTTREIISILNRYLHPHNIVIKKAKLGFVKRTGVHLNSIENMFPEIIMESIFLKPTLNIFNYFEFARLNTGSEINNTDIDRNTSITDLLTIYKAFTNRKTLEIETYKTHEEIIMDVKTKYK